MATKTLTDWMESGRITQESAAARLGVTRQRVQQMLSAHEPVYVELYRNDVRGWYIYREVEKTD